MRLQRRQAARAERHAGALHDDLRGRERPEVPADEVPRAEALDLRRWAAWQVSSNWNARCEHYKLHARSRKLEILCRSDALFAASRGIRGGFEGSQRNLWVRWYLMVEGAIRGFRAFVACRPFSAVPIGAVRFKARDSLGERVTVRRGLECVAKNS